MWSVEVGIHRRTDGQNDDFFFPVFVAIAAAAGGGTELISSVIDANNLKLDFNLESQGLRRRFMRFRREGKGIEWNKQRQEAKEKSNK